MPKEKYSLLNLPALQNIEYILEKFPQEINLTKGHYKDIGIIFQGGKFTIFQGPTDIRDFSFVWLTSDWINRDIAYAIHRYLIFHGREHSSVEQTTSKITDCTIFALNDLPMPETCFFATKNITDAQIEYIESICQYPIIIKDTRGSRGKYSELAVDYSDLQRKIAQLPKDRYFFFQGFVPNEYDWGVMVVNGEVVSGEKSYGKEGEFRNNLANGAREDFVDIKDIPDHVKDIAIKACGALGLSWSRADIIIDKDTGNPYLLEVNRFPSAEHNTGEEEGAYKFLASHIGTKM